MVFEYDPNWAQWEALVSTNKASSEASEPTRSTNVSEMTTESTFNCTVAELPLPNEELQYSRGRKDYSRNGEVRPPYEGQSYDHKE